MAKGKNKKVTVAPEKTKQKPVIIKTAYECEQCNDKCTRGLAYIEQLKISQMGKGCVCKK